MYIGICRSKFYALQEMAMFRYRNYCKIFRTLARQKQKQVDIEIDGHR